MDVFPQFSPTAATNIQSLIRNHISMYLELSITTFTIHNNTSRTVAHKILIMIFCVAIVQAYRVNYMTIDPCFSFDPWVTSAEFARLPTMINVFTIYLKIHLRTVGTFFSKCLAQLFCKFVSRFRYLTIMRWSN